MPIISHQCHRTLVFTTLYKNNEMNKSFLITFTFIKSLQQSLPYAAWDCLMLAYESLDGSLCLKREEKVDFTDLLMQGRTV